MQSKLDFAIREKPMKNDFDCTEQPNFLRNATYGVFREHSLVSIRSGGAAGDTTEFARGREVKSPDIRGGEQVIEKRATC